MKIKHTKMASALFAAGVISTAGSVFYAASSHAQQTLPPVVKAERIEVTGSNIKRVEGEAATPVIVISIDDLEKAGVTNAEQAMKLITQQQGGTVTSGSVSATNGAASYASLRNLGAQRTLVLLNGKRIVSNPFASVAVDLNTLPLAAIQRIEVLTDGASATYGTDAIAGVINFITRKDYRGLIVGAEAQIPSGTGGEVYKFDIVGGMGDMGKQGWNVVAGFNYREGKPMLGTDREFMRSSFIPAFGLNGTSGTTFPANYSQGALTTNPSLPNCSAPTSLNTGVGPIGSGTNLCRADTQAPTQVVPIQDQWSAFTRGTFAINANHTATFEYFHSYNRVKSQIAPSPETGLTMDNTSPFFPGNGITPITDSALNRNATISVGWRTTVLGARQGEQVNNTQRAVAGLEGNFGGWDYQASYLWSNSKVDNTFLNGYPTTAAMIAGVRGTGGAPFLNPFGNQTAAGLAYLQANTVTGKVQEGEGTLSSFSGVLSRALGKLAGGDIVLALNTEFRKEDMVYKADIAKVSQAASSGLAGSGALRVGDRSVDAIGAELILPVLKNLEFGLSVRRDKYSDFGSTTNPKGTVRFQPIDDLVIRASYNKGFAAPTLTQLYSPNSTSFTPSPFNDPLLCPNGVVNVAAGGVPSRDCRLQFQQLQGGNTALTPEKSTAWTMGAVFQITPKMSVGFDLWQYRVDNNISTLGDTTIFGDPTRYASLFVRCSQAPAARVATIGACRVPGGDPLAYVINTNQNLGNTKIKGIDIQFNWQSGATPYGNFAASLRGSYVTEFLFQVVKDGPFLTPLGNFNASYGGPVIRYQQVTNFSWQRADWGVNLLHRYQSGYVDQNGTSVAPAFRNNKVGAYALYDLSVNYSGIKNLGIQLGVLNLLDKDPPFTNQTARFQARGYDDRIHNPLGRVYSLNAKYTFK